MTGGFSRADSSIDGWLGTGLERFRSSRGFLVNQQRRTTGGWWMLVVSISRLRKGGDDGDSRGPLSVPTTAVLVQQWALIDMRRW